MKGVTAKQWCHTNHLSKDLPKEHSSEKDLETYCSHLTRIHDVTIINLGKCLLEHLLNLAQEKELELPVKPKKEDKEKALTIDRVHSVVLNSLNVYNKEYLSRVLEFIKMPQKQERGWLQLATNDVTERFQVRIMHDGHKVIFLLRRLQTELLMTLKASASAGACFQLGQSGMTGCPGLKISRCCLTHMF